MNTTLTDLEYAGSFTVDSGQAMVGDPCYINDWDTNSGDDWAPENHDGEYSYQGASNTTTKYKFGEIGNSNAVVFETGYGDGVYPVYVKLNKDGRVAQVVIDFDSLIEKTEETE